MLNQKKVEIFLVKIRKSLAKQFLEVAYNSFTLQILHNIMVIYTTKNMYICKNNQITIISNN